MNLIILGAPGAGKGTQAEIISREYKIPHVSTGNIIREAISEGTQTGLAAKAYIDAGKLVPDDVVINIIKERLNEEDCKNGFILDGFPRTIVQAAALDSLGFNIDKVISIFVADETIVKRISGRRVCNNCGATYNIEHKKPKTQGVCDICSSTLTLRADDTPETVNKRLKVYHSQTKPLEDYYKKQSKLHIVEGQEKVEDTTALTFKVLEDEA